MKTLTIYYKNGKMERYTMSGCEIADKLHKIYADSIDYGESIMIIEIHNK